MTLHANDQPILVAPRPVRLSSVFVSRSPFVHERTKSTEVNSNHDFHLALVSTESGLDGGDHQVSRPISRSALPTEALEEFLSILKPSFFPPASPSFRPRIRQPLSPLPIQPNTRRLLTMPSPGKKEVLEDSENVPSRQPSRSAQSSTPETAAELDELVDRFNESMNSFRWYKGSLLSSPISRTHTKNPFLRQSINRPSSSASRAPTPCSIPLPLPTPDELLDIASD